MREVGFLRSEFVEDSADGATDIDASAGNHSGERRSQKDDRVRDIYRLSIPMGHLSLLREAFHCRLQVHAILLHQLIGNAAWARPHSRADRSGRHDVDYKQLPRNIALRSHKSADPRVRWSRLQQRTPAAEFLRVRIDNQFIAGICRLPAQKKETV